MNPSDQTAAQRRRILIKMAVDAVCLTIATASFVAWQIMGQTWAMWPMLAAVSTAVGAQIWLHRANRS